MTASLSVTGPRNTVQALHTLADRSIDARQAHRLRAVAMVLGRRAPAVPRRRRGGRRCSRSRTGLSSSLPAGRRGLSRSWPGSRRWGVQVAPV